MNQHHAPIEKLMQETYRSDTDNSLDDRTLSEASTAMKQAWAAHQQTRSVSKWRRIMRSPITRAAAVIAVIVSIVWATYQTVGNPIGTPTFSTLLNAATATENAWFTGEQTVHIVKHIVIYPQHDANDLGTLMENLESNYDLTNLEAFARRFLTPQGMAFFSLDQNGNRHDHQLELVDPQAGKATIEDHIWYDPDTGRYARLLTRTDQVLFVHSFDGQRVHLAQRDDQGKLKVQSNPATASFSAPQDLAGFLGSTTARVRQLLDGKDMLIRSKPTESTLRGKAVDVYKLSYIDFLDEGLPYVQLSVDKNDQSFVRIEFITNQKTTMTIDHLSRTQGELPPVGWDMSALPGSHETAVPDVTVRSEMGRSGLTVQEMAERATLPVYVFGKDPYGTLRRTIYESIDWVSPTDRAFAIIYKTQQNIAVGLLQSPTLDRFAKAQNIDLQTVQGFLTTSHGFKVCALDANQNAYILNLLFVSLNKKAADNRSCYLLLSPDDQILFLGIDGWLSHHELEQLIESMVSAQDYKPTNESLPKPVVDLNVATHTELKHNDNITRWLLLGRFDYAYDSDPNDIQAQKKAFDQDVFDHNDFVPQVRVGNEDYAWTSCYAIHSGPEQVYGVSTPGICYGRTRIIMAKPTRAVLAIKSSDPVRVWLNGQLIHEALGIAYYYHVTKSVPVTFRSGKNHLVYQTLRFIGDAWLFSCRFQAGSTTLYESTTEEQARGFIAVQGDGPEPRPRLERLDVDLGRRERDLLPVKLVGLSALDTVSIRLSGPGAPLCRPWVEKDNQLHLGTQTALGPARPARIWLDMDSGTHNAGVYELTVHLSSGLGAELLIPGTVTIHDVFLPAQQTMGIKVCKDIIEFSGGPNTQPEAQKRLEVFLDDLAALRTNICNWEYLKHEPDRFLPLVKIAGTDQTLQATGQAGVIDINNLPDLDFSYFDPWIAGAAQRGLTHLHVYANQTISHDCRKFVTGVLGDDQVYSDEIAWKTIMWLFSQFRDYAVSRGITETWADIGWELSPTTITEYVQTASRFQTIGYHTYAHKSGFVSQNAKWLNQLNPQSDAWYMNYYYTPEFLRHTRSPEGNATVPSDEGDQLWYNNYGTCNSPYEEGRTKAWYALAIGAHGYSWWNYSRGNPKESIVWYDQEKACIIHSPIWHGMRDGNEAAAYYHLLQERLQSQGDQAELARLAALTGKTEDARLRNIKVNYNGPDTDRPIGFQQFNQAKREVLEMLSKILGEEGGQYDENDMNMSVAPASGQPGRWMIWGIDGNPKPTSAPPSPVEMVFIPSGTFMMGSPSDEQDRDPDEGPQHQVTLTQGFYMGKYEVTVGQYATFLEATSDESGVDWNDHDCPLARDDGRYTLREGRSWHQHMAEVSWYGAAMYCNYVSEIEGLESVYNLDTWEVDWNANGYRLPTEAEWEYACRAGTQTRFYWGDDPATTAHLKSANAFDLYGMSGNVYEWCQDWYGSYTDSNQTDPLGPSSGSNRVLRGGFRGEDARNYRSAQRHQDSPDAWHMSIGFRLLRSNL